MLRCGFVVALFVGLVAAGEWNLPSTQAQGETVEIVSGGRTYPAYLAAPSIEGRKPAVILLHSINGFEPGYKELTDRLMMEGFVTLSLQWQTFERTPPDSVLEQLLRDAISYLSGRPDVHPEQLGLTGFCIGGRYTMLFLPFLILHGTADRPSPIADIYRYATELDRANKYFELKIYQGQPHSFDNL